jgi:general secretion pathway protein I
MRRHRNERGFTLIEVLVALAIIAVAMAAAVRVAGLMTQSNGLLRDKSMAMLAAQSRLAELQLSSGKKTFACDQGRLKLRCEQTLSNSPDSQLVQVDVQVRDASREAPPLARLATTLARPQVKAE